MLEKLVKRKFYRDRHQKAPLLEEREPYLEMLSEQGYTNKSLRQIANHLYWVVQLLPLENPGIIINSDLLDNAVERWSRSQVNITKGLYIECSTKAFQKLCYKISQELWLFRRKDT